MSMISKKLHPVAIAIEALGLVTAYIGVIVTLIYGATTAAGYVA